MSTKDLIIAIILMLVCLLGFKPALKNFKVVLDDKTNPKVNSRVRLFVLFWLGLGVICLGLGFFVIAYSVGVRFGWFSDFKL